MREKITTAVNYINLFGMLFLTATVIINSLPLRQIGYYIFLISYMFEFFLEKKWQNIQFQRRHIYYLGMFLFFVLAFLYYPFDSNTYFKKLIEYRYPLLGFAIVGFFGVNSKYKLNYFLNTFIISAVAVVLYLIFFKVGIVEFILNPERDALFTFYRIENLTAHMMFNFCLNISLISIWYILTRSWKRIKMWKRSLYIGTLIILFFILYLSEGRSGFLAAILLMLGFVFFEVWKMRKSIGIIVALLIPFVFVGLASHHERMSEQMLKGEARLFLWKAAVEVVKEKPIFGNGISTAQEKYNIYRDKHETAEFKVYRLDKQKNAMVDCHNQYLQTTMEFGIVGLCLLLFLYVFPFFIVEERRKLFSFFLLALSAYQSIFDMFMTAQFATVFCILIVLILNVKNDVVIQQSTDIS